MKIKDIEVGQNYKLISSKKSRVGCAAPYFELFKDEDLLVLSKYNNFNNKNIVQVQGVCQKGDIIELVSFWCSPYDLKETSAN